MGALGVLELSLLVVDLVQLLGESLADLLGQNAVTVLKNLLRVSNLALVKHVSGSLTSLVDIGFEGLDSLRVPLSFLTQKSFQG